MTAWGLDIAEVTPQLESILAAPLGEAEAVTPYHALFGYGREPLILLGIMPFGFLSIGAVLWIAPTKFACGRAFGLRRECVKLGREFLLAQRWRLYAEIDPADRTALAFARVFGFEERCVIDGRQVMELPRCS